MDATQPIPARVAALLAQMTNEEKQWQTIHYTAQMPPETAAKIHRNTSIGALCGMGRGTLASLEKQNEVQRVFVTESRLGIPATFHTETLHSSGVGSTIFPMPCMQGATWNAPLVGEVARAVAVQGRANGVDRGFSPEINVCTDPRLRARRGEFRRGPVPRRRDGRGGGARTPGRQRGRAFDVPRGCERNRERG